MIYKIFLKHTLLFIIGAHIFVYIIDVLGEDEIYQLKKVINLLFHYL